MPKPQIYSLTRMPEFPGELRTNDIDHKNRGYVPTDISTAIQGRNRFFISSLKDRGSPFSFKRPNIYMGSDLIARLSEVKSYEEISEENLVHILGDPPLTVDVTGINSTLFAVPATIGNNEFLVSRAFFDWKLYESQNTSLPFEEYFELDYDPKHGILLTRFLSRLNVSQETGVGYKGWGDLIIIGNPEYLKPKISIREGGKVLRLEKS